jgi:lysophospholipase L1-like esterase
VFHQSTMIKFHLPILILAMLSTGVKAADTVPPSVEIQKSDWHGFERQSFSITGHAACVIVPHIAAPGKPWVWRTSFPDDNPTVDLELVRDGYHIGYIEIQDLLGSDAALDQVDQFYRLVRAQWGLAEKMTVETSGPSGLAAHRYAARHSERIACIYGDAPVIPDVYESVRFIMDHSDVLPKGKEYFQLRDGLGNCQSKFENEKTGRVAFLGGSITFNPGWRDELMRYLQKRFPQTKFDFIAAGIPSLGSVPDAFRLERDVLSHGPVDLLFVEAAVNDGTNIPDQPELMLKGMEGIVRHVRTISPQTDIVQMHFVMPQFIADYNAGKISAPIAQHERVAEAYGCASLNLALEVTDRIGVGEFTWSDFHDIHPSAYGQRVYSNSMMRMLDAAWDRPPAPTKAHLLPKTPLDASCFVSARFGKLEDVKLGVGFKLVSDWEPSVSAGTRSGYVHVPALVATAPGSGFAFDFDGNAVGLMIGAGPDTGIVEVSIDGAASRRIDTFTQWSRHLYLPWAIMLGDGLKQGHHTVNVKMTADHNSESTGTALYVFQLLLN